ncbi:MAG TPA: NUDIX hydrolase [Actinocrinis sp.]|jgi:ADP-ribose pyrophosphatase
MAEEAEEIAPGARSEDALAGGPLADAPEQWPVESSTDLAHGGIATFRRDRVRMIDGSVANREYIVHPGAVAVVLLDDAERVLMLRQYRHPVRHQLWELPAGLLDKPGEAPLAAAERELYEEAHLKAGRWAVLADYWNTAGSSDEAMRLFLARDFSEADGEPFARVAEEAGLVSRWVPRGELLEAVLAGRVGTGSSVVAALALHAAFTRPGGLDALRPADAPWPARPF